MIVLITEALLSGIITLIIGFIIFNLSINKNNKNNKNHPIGIDVAFFSTGFILYVFITFIEYKFIPSIDQN
jgi:membrane protein CcdC involved in cytochrome C biogenesis